MGNENIHEKGPVVRRQHCHRRSIQGDGYQRDDGLWDIEATLLDTKSYDMRNKDRGGIAAGEALHQMRVIMTIDSEFVIREIRAETMNAPFNSCPVAADKYASLQGLRIASGWMVKVRQRLTTVDGCTHITELLQYMATVAFQTIFPLTTGQTEMGASRRDDKVKRRPTLLNRCHGYREDGPVVKEKWPEFHKG